MPLYMDFHKFPAITVEDAKKAHTADEKIQNKYGVKFLQYWLNEKTGAVFCLVEGPDKPTVELVHQTAHGHIACAMVEVDRGYYELIMGGASPDKWGLVRNETGAVDLGYRNVVSVNIHNQVSKTSSKKNVLAENRQGVSKIFLKHNGRSVKILGTDNLFGVFNDASQAVKCAREIQATLKLRVKNTKASFSIGVSAGQPVTEQDEFFEEAIKLSRRLCGIAEKNNILISSLVKELSDEEGNTKKLPLKSLSSTDETFITHLFKYVEENLSDERFNIDKLNRELGISRAQLYRKMITLTTKSPNDFIRDLRLDKALSLLKRKSGNISEVALESGFSNPSYFSKCFTKKFGCTPSKFVEYTKGSNFFSGCAEQIVLSFDQHLVETFPFPSLL